MLPAMSDRSISPQPLRVDAVLPARPQHGARELDEVVDAGDEGEEHHGPEGQLAHHDEASELIAEDKQAMAMNLGTGLVLPNRNPRNVTACFAANGRRTGT